RDPGRPGCRPRHRRREAGVAPRPRPPGPRARGRALLRRGSGAAGRRALRGAVRILHVIQELRTGGAERILVSAYRGAREAGHDVFGGATPGPVAAELDTTPSP